MNIPFETETLADITAALDRTMMSRADPMGDALLGVAVFTTTLLDVMGQRAAASGIEFPGELRIAQAALDAFLLACGITISEVGPDDMGLHRES